MEEFLKSEAYPVVLKPVESVSHAIFIYFMVLLLQHRHVSDFFLLRNRRDPMASSFAIPLKRQKSTFMF